MKVYLCIGFNKDDKIIKASIFFHRDNAEEFMSRTLDVEYWMHGYRDVY